MSQDRSSVKRDARKPDPEVRRASAQPPEQDFKTATGGDSPPSFRFSRDPDRSVTSRYPREQGKRTERREAATLSQDSQPSRRKEARLGLVKKCLVKIAVNMADRKEENGGKRENCGIFFGPSEVESTPIGYFF
jgi:hypothetical protein